MYGRVSNASEGIARMSFGCINGLYQGEIKARFTVETVAENVHSCCNSCIWMNE